jgi:hypothetical protein
MKAWRLNERVLDGYFIAEIFELRVTNSRTEVELERTSSRPDDCIRECQGLQVEADKICHHNQILEP